MVKRPRSEPKCCSSAIISLSFYVSMNTIGKRGASRLIAHPGSAWLTPGNAGRIEEGKKKTGFWCRTLISLAWAPVCYSCCCSVTALRFRGTPSSEFWKASVNVKRTWPLRSYQHVCWCIQQPRKGFSGPSETQERERKKKNKRKDRKRKIVIQSEGFLKEQFEGTTLMP